MTNPAARPDLELVSHIAGGSGSGVLPLGGRLAPTDATLGVEGVPQSATGHTALLTGVNAAKLLGRHSILRDTVNAGRTAGFLNTFGPQFFGFPRTKRRRLIAATTTATLAAGLPLRTIEDNLAGRSVSHDLTNAWLKSEGADLPNRSPAEAGAVVAAAARELDFALFEHFQPDRAGHAGDPRECAKVLRRDIEELRTRGHTLNPAAVAIFGPNAAERAAHVRDLTDVNRVMREALGLPKLAA